VNRSCEWLVRTCVSALVAGAATVSAAAAPSEETTLEPVVVTARLRAEDAQNVPISLSVITDAQLDSTFTQSPQLLTRLVPSLNYSSPNPRNTAMTIRGLGSSVVAIAQANDGLEPGVGFYVDGVYHARPATAAFDFMDLERVEVLRGPQGTLFGKNTTAGAMSLTTQAPSFTPGFKAELAGGNYGYLQARASATGPLVDGLLAGRITGSTTDRNGVLKNTKFGGDRNDVNNAALRGQLLLTPTNDFSLRLIADYSSIDTLCCTQVYVRVSPTLKTAARQYPALAAGLNYTPPSPDYTDRLTDIDAGLKVRSNEGGVAATAEWDLGAVKLTSISAWRYWNWAAANDRDYTGLQIQTLQGIPSRQDQFSEELRIAGGGAGSPLDYVAGLYGFKQTIVGHPTTAYGSQATYWLLGPAPTFPSNLLTGYRTDGHTRFESNSAAAFGELTFHATGQLSLTGGLRYTHESKNGDYNAPVSGGLATTTPALVNAKLSILRPQAYTAEDKNNNLSGRLVAAFQWTPDVMTYAIASKGAKSGGINMSGLPLNASNLPALNSAVVKPERVTTYELGAKTKLWDNRVLLNADVFHTDVKDFQANVVDTGPGALRGYLANVPKVRVQGFELDATMLLTERLSLRASTAWNDGKYVSYVNGPCPLERIGNATAVCDLSGRPLSNLPRWNGSIGADYSQPMDVSGLAGKLFVRADLAARTWIYGDSTDSLGTRIGGYGVLNASVGFNHDNAWEFSVWARNLTGRDSLQNVTIQAGNSGLVVGTPGDPRMVGATLRINF
jgi:iron complex outermembrane recepter protein